MPNLSRKRFIKSVISWQQNFQMKAELPLEKWLETVSRRTGMAMSTIFNINGSET